MRVQYNPDEIVALDARKMTLRTALHQSPNQISATAVLWRDEGLEPSHYDARHIIELRNTMALEEYETALRAFAFAGKHATQDQRGNLADADAQLERFGLTNKPKRIAVMDAVWAAARRGHFTDEIANDTEVFYPSNGSIWKGTRIAIHAIGLNIVPDSQDFAPHQWLNEDGFIDPELARQYSYPHQAA
ncbi:MAG: hypothetical protein ABSG88_03765 [Bradyrhizobium sp.]